MDYTRASKRQNGGGFGVLPAGASATTTLLERQQFNTYGAEARLRRDWGATNQHAFTAGAQFYHSRSPRTDSRGNRPDAENGDVLTRSLRKTRYAPVFVENLFRLGRLGLTPGLRWESIRQRVTEDFNLAKQSADVPLGTAHDRQDVPLFGLAAALTVASKTHAYANVSQSYRPIVFTQAVPTGGTATVPGNLTESRATNFELGLRRQSPGGLVLDASVFHLDFDHQIGTVSLPGGRSTVGNVGRSVHRGIEGSLRHDLLARFNLASRSALSAYVNAMVLHARFQNGPLTGRTPQLAPRHLFRAGFIYSRGDTAKLALLATRMDRSFGDDNNTPERQLPRHTVLDLTAEAKIPHTHLRLIGGINNLLDENYFSRVTNAGIDPAPRRNAYLGAALEF